MTSLARGPVGAEPPGAARPDGTREPDGTGHPALRGLPAVWLRANCPCAGCQDPGSGQRLAAITGLPADVTVARVLASDAAVEVIFGPDGHRAVFAADWLARYGDPGGEAGTGPGPGPPDDDRTEDAKRLWAAADLGGGIPQGWWPRYLADPEHRSACLSAVLTHGVVVLHDVPGEPGAVLAVARSLGYVRETNYGRLFDVRAEPAAANLAFTRLPIAPHTDNPYRDPVPTIQLLHCLHAAAGRRRLDLHRRLPRRRGAPRAGPGRVHLPHHHAGDLRLLGRGRRAPRHQPDDRPRPARADTPDPPQRPVPRPGAAARGAGPGVLRRLPRLRRAGRRCGGAGHDDAGPRRLRHLRQHPGPARPDRLRRRRGHRQRHGRRHLQGCYADLDGLASTVAVLARGQAGQGGQAGQDERAGQAGP